MPPRRPNRRGTLPNEATASFSSWKFDWINAFASSNLRGVTINVAIALLQHANAETRLIFPSQERIAAEVGCSITSVERAIHDLVDEGWIAVTRHNRHQTNEYEFLEGKKSEVVGKRQLRLDLFETDRSERLRHPAKMRGPNHVDPASLLDRDPSKMTGLDPAGMTGKHLKGTTTRKHLNLGHEDSETAMPLKRTTAVGSRVSGNVGYLHRLEPAISPNFDAIEREMIQRERRRRQGHNDDEF